MLISRKYAFIFIHIYKNAGTSITQALLPFAVNEWEQKAHIILKKIGISYFDQQPYDDHLTASELVSRIGKSFFDKYFSFAIVRNPWDWQVSLYTYMLKNTKHYQHELITGFNGFDEYIEWRCTQEVGYQRDFVYSEDGELLVDFVGRFEHLEDDFQHICSQIGISTSLPKSNVSNTKPYQDFYNEKTKELVKLTFEPDISTFNYEFD